MPFLLIIRASLASRINFPSDIRDPPAFHEVNLQWLISRQVIKASSTENEHKQISYAFFSEEMKFWALNLMILQVRHDFMAKRLIKKTDW